MPAKKKPARAKKTPSVAKQIIGTRSGARITLDDSRQTLTLETPGGHMITMSDQPMVVNVVDNNGNSVKLDPAGITIVASARITIRATDVKLSAGSVNVEAALSKFSGAIQCDTVVTNSVVSASYTPGAGNIW